MGVNHRSAYIAVPQQLLNRPNVVAVLEQMCGERVSQRVATRRLRYPNPQDSLTHAPLQHRLVQMMTATPL